MDWRARLQETIGRGLYPTKRVEIGRGALGALPTILEDLGLPRRLLVIAQPETWGAAGELFQEMTGGSGLSATVHISNARTVTWEACRDIASEIASHPSLLPVALGAGTVNDLVKLGVQEAATPYVCVATAASMNGYPSPISAVLREGLKCTVPATPPLVIIGDTQVLCDAPKTLTGSGYADLLAKPCSVADWLLAREAAGEPFAEEPLRIMDGVVEAVIEAGGAIAAGRPEAVELLMRGLTLSGLSMAAAGTSQPASGAEHLISHFWDMLGHRDGWRLDLHGRQVGVACVMVSALWQRLLSLDREALVPAPQQDAEALAPALRLVYGELAEPCLAEFRRKSPSDSVIEARVARARGAWTALHPLLSQTVVSPERMRAELAAGGTPVTLSEIGRDPDDARLALRWGRAMRNRYTCLDLAAEIGLLDDWVEGIVSEVC